MAPGGYFPFPVSPVIFNPRRGCAASVTVVGWPHSCVSMYLPVCYHASEGIARLYSKMKIPTAVK